MSMGLVKMAEKDLKERMAAYRARVCDAKTGSKVVKKFCSKIDQGFSKLGVTPTVNIDVRGYVDIYCKDTAEATRVAAMVVRKTCIRKLRKEMRTWVESENCPVWYWSGNNDGKLVVTVTPATPGPDCKPTIRTTTRKDSSWVCEMQA